jgi:hypothetical protein
MNHANLNNPNSNLANVNFGRILGSGNPRVIQLALKYMF